MTSMLIGMGVAQSGQVVGKIGETFGVSNLALDTEGWATPPRWWSAAMYCRVCR
jgi:autotransporter translocation and assembly factor TamB